MLSKSFYTKLQLPFVSLLCQTEKVLFSSYILKWKVKNEWGRPSNLNVSGFEVGHCECFSLLLKYGKAGKQGVIIIVQSQSLTLL